MEIVGVERLQRSFTAKRIKLTVIFLSYKMTRPCKTFLKYSSKSYKIFFLLLYCFQLDLGPVYMRCMMR